MVFGVALPAYNTFKSLKERHSRQIIYWNIYWISFGAYKLCAFVGDYTIYWVPLYDVGKMLFVLWLSSTTTKGSLVLYESILGPVLKQHEGTIDGALDAVKKVLLDKMKFVFDYFVDCLKESLNNTRMKGANDNRGESKSTDHFEFQSFIGATTTTNEESE